MRKILFLAGFFLAVNLATASVPKTDPPPKPITVIDQGIIYTLTAHNHETVSEILKNNGFVLTSGDILSLNPDTIISPQDTIYIYHAIPITIIDAGVKSETFTLTNTVDALLQEKNIILNDLDILSPDKQTSVKPGLTIKIKRRTIENITEIQEIPFDKTTLDDPNASYGKVVITKTGTPGKKQADIELLKEDGSVIKKRTIKETVLTKPITQEETRGTRILIGKTDDGLGSWYNAFPGMYAASTTYPRKSYVRVTNLNNDKSIIVKINDYGPTIPGRIIDLEATAFKLLAPLSKGVIPVRVEQLL